MPSPDATTITLRRAAPADAPCIAVLATQVYLDTYAVDGIRAPIARDVLHKLSPGAIAQAMDAPGTSFTLAESNGHLLGFAQWRAAAPHALVAARPAAELNRLYVQERFTGRGLGRRLLADTEAHARAAGSAALWLTAWVGNARALAFYAAQGYRDVGTDWFEFETERIENRLLLKTFERSDAGAPMPRRA